jgi:hypothetical protein
MVVVWVPAGAGADALPPSGFVPVVGATGVQGSAAAVSAAGPNAVWLVGARTIHGVQRPLVEEWTGSAWRLDTLPTGLRGYLSDVEAVSPTDVWAVGTVLHDGSPRGLVLRYDGTSWRRARAPARSHGLGLVTARSDGRVYVAGAAESSELGCGDVATRLSRWTGTAWRVMAGLDDGCSEDGDSMSAIQAVPHGPLLISDTEEYHEVGPAPALICLKTPCPTPGPPFPSFDDWGDISGALPAITATGPGDVWLAGNTEHYGDPQAVLDHWDGSAWTMLTSTATDIVDVTGVAETGPDDTWLAGSLGWARYEVLTPLLYHATGGVLTQLASPTPSGTLASITHVPGTGSEMWAVGTEDGQPLILHHP